MLFNWDEGQQMIRREGRHTMANGVRLHYVRFVGDGAPLVLLPGITSPAATWEFVAEALAAHNDVYVMDIRGRGLSQGGGDLGYQLDDYAADAADFIRVLPLDKPAILGHSMGARIAVRLAARHPGSIGKLVLADPPVSGPGRRSYPIPLAFYLESLDAAQRGQGYEEMRKGLGWSDAQLDRRMEWLPTCDPKAIADSHRSFNAEDIHKDMPSIAAETLLLYAEQGGTVLDADAAEIAQAIPNCRSQRIDGAGHMIPWDRLDAFVGAVHDFLNSKSR
jgi:N-formylmaleamate deformylase